MSDSLHLLKTKRFLPLFITQFFGAFNDNAFKNAFLIWFTYDVAAESGINVPMMITLAAGLFILPFFLFSATAGQVADKYEKSWLTQKIKQIEIILMIACAIGLYLQSVYFLLVILFLMGIQSTFFGPIKYSLLPEHLKDDELIAGNGLIEGGTFLSILLGTIFGGLIIRAEYGVETLSIFIMLFAIVGWLGSRSIPKSPIGDAGLKIGWNIFIETWKIIKFAQQERTVWLSIIGISWFWLIGATFLTQFPVYTSYILGGDETIVTLLLTIFSVGIGIGSVLCNKLLKGEINGKLVPWGCIGMTVSIVVFCWASNMYDYPMFPERGCLPSPEWVCEGDSISVSNFIQYHDYSLFILGSLFSLSIFSGIYIVPLYAIMQHRSENKYLARIIAANNVLNALFMVLASVIALGLFALGLTITQVLLAVGLANIPVFFVVRGVIKKRLDNA